MQAKVSTLPAPQPATITPDTAIERFERLVELARRVRSLREVADDWKASSLRRAALFDQQLADAQSAFDQLVTERGLRS